MRLPCAALIFVLVLCTVAVDEIAAYQLTRTPSVTRQQSVGRASNTALYGLLGRFRKNRKVEQVATIKVGDKLPVGVDVERILTSSENGEQLSEAVAIQYVLGSKKALLVGMYCVRL
jgi:glycerol kinase